MKKISVLVIVLTLGFINSSAEYINMKAVKEAIKNLEFVKEGLEKQKNDLNDKLNAANKYASLCLSRVSIIPGSNSMKIEDFISQFPSIYDLYGDERSMQYLKDAPDSDLKRTYLLILDMIASLNNPYDEITNDQYIKDAAIYKTLIVDNHIKEFNDLVSQINDYYFYMLELAKVFEAADKDNYETKAEKLAVEEEADFLIYVPYTIKVLKEYIKNKGDLPKSIQIELGKSCPKAFPKYKYVR